ncbi:3-hydroxybutyrate dehydrogenase [Psychrosphaera sp. B3R10]|uniref:3-hydroxybutyrate dehydrogenase n=1 Tax=unclassified Psychrosphaera TaxID=2641570 RepID=UPI001C088721|nr:MULTISPECIES: 3-hydroxybutyrate dehydrogenase [unclassified Psychrosphaera]MBU2882141.1 3-hydroxybutyrate dehydrogenase [Psychrosphaera sp. I2R16]MBU2988822.1 3-hydroxybutyrate dehydrogenase [Psychrosphaera sp. B3R10]MDO6717842.1 3-hydroxybutyrate dehydrogenase [Psychrosphaera sp. 1_MG-2023]
MLKGKIALVTGSTSGIGLATVEVLANAGCHIVVHGLVEDHIGEQIAQELAEKYNVLSYFSNANMADQNQILEMFSFIEQELGTVDILVNNAGIQHTAPVHEFPKDKWDLILAVNLSSAFHTTQAVLPKMQLKKWGRIVNIASVHGLVGSVNKSAYVAAKHGLVGLTKVTAIENANMGVTVNAICPGWVETPLINQQIQDIADKDGSDLATAKAKLVTAKQPRAEMAAPSQIGELIQFLCSDAAAGITGASLPIDGGWTAQ